MVTAGFLLAKAPPKQTGKRSAGVSEAYREMIELDLSRGRNAMGIFQDLVDTHGFTGGYQSVKLRRQVLTIWSLHSSSHVMMGNASR